MENSWGFIKRRFNQRDREDVGAAVTTAPPQPAAPDGFSSAPRDPAQALDAIGQQDEMIRVRISHLSNRLEDVASLKSDFASLIEPISSFAAEYPRLRVKLAETEAVLQEERETTAQLGHELRTLSGDNLRLSDELSAVTARQAELAELARENATVIENIRRSLKEKDALIGELERQLFAEQERARAIFDENQFLRNEAQAADLAASRQEGDLAEARQTIALLEHDNRTLRAGSSEQAQRLAAVSSAYGEIEQQFRGAREKLAQVEAQLAAEQNLRHRLETLSESERSTYQSNVASLEMKVDGLASRLSVTEKILQQAREEVRKKTEELRTAERIAKDASTEKNTLERRFEAVQNEMREVVEPGGSRKDRSRAA